MALARARLQAEELPFATEMCVPFVMKPVAVPPAGNSGLPNIPNEGLSSGKITVFPPVGGRFTLNWDGGAIEKLPPVKGFCAWSRD